MSEQTARSSKSSQPVPAQQPTWWEKTVEYKFVLQCLQEAADVAPLGGHLVEPAEGDLRLMFEGNVALIEFKRDIQSISDEARKYEIGPARYPVGAGVSVFGMPALEAMRAAVAKRDEPLPAKADEETLNAAISVLDKLAAALGHHLIFGHLGDVSLELKRLQYSKLDKRWAKQAEAGSAVQGGDAEQTSTSPVVPSTSLECVSGDEMVKYLKVLAELRGRRDAVGSGGFVVAISKDGKGKHVYPLSIVLQAVLPKSEAAPDALASRTNPSSKKYGI